MIPRLFIFLLWAASAAAQVTLSGGVTLAGKVALGREYPVLASTFDARLSGEAGSAGDAITVPLANSMTESRIAITWALSGSAGTYIKIGVGDTNQSTLPNPFYFGNAVRWDTGTRGLSISNNPASDQSIDGTLKVAADLISFGFYYWNGWTNDPVAYNVDVGQYISQNGLTYVVPQFHVDASDSTSGWRIHADNSGGSLITSVPRQTWLWITGWATTFGTANLEVYNAATHAQYGATSTLSISGNPFYLIQPVLIRHHASPQVTRSGFDNWIFVTGAAGRILPWNWP